MLQPDLRQGIGGLLMSLNNVEKVRVVTPEQYRNGYIVRIGMRVETRRWSLVRKLDDGNYLVRIPVLNDGSVAKGE